MSDTEKLRIDKWLWAVRLYKTRSLASEACLSGKVKIDGDRIKPAKLIKIGDIITVRKGIIIGTYRVTGLLAKRGSAPIAAQNVEDLTPPEELHKLKSAFATPLVQREKGMGRPTKKQRRQMDKTRRKF